MAPGRYDLLDPTISEYAVNTSSEKQNSYGRPSTKAVCDWIDASAVLCTFLCFIASYIVVTPRLSIAWDLGFNNQIIIIGFMLALTNLCNRRVMTRVFVVAELRWGSSTLQNYDAILRQSVFVSQADFSWRTVIFLLSMLPLGLSVAYKTFTNGEATQPVQHLEIGQYGVFNKPMGIWSGTGYETNWALLDMMAPWRAANTSWPTAFPQPFGYNILMLDPEQVVVLDMPNATLLGQAQSSLGAEERFSLEVAGRGTLARRNTSTPELLADDNFWTSQRSLISLPGGFRNAITLSNVNQTAASFIGGYQGGNSRLIDVPMIILMRKCFGTLVSSNSSASIGCPAA